MKKFLTLGQMSILREIGVDVTPKGTGMIYSAVGGEYKLMYADTVCEDDIKAFDFQDIFCLLHARIEVHDCNYFISVGKAVITYMSGFHSPIMIRREELIDAACDMLMCLLKNKYL